MSLIEGLELTVRRHKRTRTVAVALPETGGASCDDARTLPTARRDAGSPHTRARAGLPHQC